MPVMFTIARRSGVNGGSFTKTVAGMRSSAEVRPTRARPVVPELVSITSTASTAAPGARDCTIWVNHSAVSSSTSTGIDMAAR